MTGTRADYDNRQVVRFGRTVVAFVLFNPSVSSRPVRPWRGGAEGPGNPEGPHESTVGVCQSREADRGLALNCAC